MSFLIYLVGIVDKVIHVSRTVSTISLLILILGTLVFVVEYKKIDKQIKDVISKILKIVGFSLVTSSFVFILTPSSKTLAAMYLIPAIMESEKMQKIDGLTDKLLDALEIKLNESLEE